MNFVDKLRDTITEALDIPFIYGTPEELNALTDNTEMPAAMCYTLQDTQMVFSGTQMTEQASVIVFFIDKTSAAFSSVENEEIIQTCKARADLWVSEIMSGSVFEVTGTIRYRRIYLEFYGIYTGIGVSIPLREFYGSCFEPERPDKPDYVLATDNNEIITTDDGFIITIQQ